MELEFQRSKFRRNKNLLGRYVNAYVRNLNSAKELESEIKSEWNELWNKVNELSKTIEIGSVKQQNRSIRPWRSLFNR